MNSLHFSLQPKLSSFSVSLFFPISPLVFPIWQFSGDVMEKVGLTTPFTAVLQTVIKKLISTCLAEEDTVHISMLGYSAFCNKPQIFVNLCEHFRWIFLFAGVLLPVTLVEVNLQSMNCLATEITEKIINFILINQISTILGCHIDRLYIFINK